MLLQKILKKIKENTKFLQIYDVHYQIVDNMVPIIKIRRKEKTLEERTQYNPDIKLVNCPVRYYYEIQCANAILFEEIYIKPIFQPEPSDKYYCDNYRRITPYNKTYNQKVFWGDFDVKSITNYIENTEYDLIFNHKTDNVVAYNTTWPIWERKQF